MMHLTETEVDNLEFMIEQTIVFKRTSTYSEWPIVIMHTDTYSLLMDMVEKHMKRKRRKLKS